MKRVVLYENLKQKDVRPDALYHEYLSLLQVECERIFGKKEGLLEIQCPVCKEALQPAFKRWGACYGRCERCLSLLVSPRPDEKILKDFSLNSKARRFWNKELGDSEAREERYRNLFRPRLEWLLAVKDQYGSGMDTVFDHYSRYPDFLQALAKSKEFKRIGVYQPAASLEGKPPLEIVNNAQDWEGRAGLFTAFESLERMFDPAALLKFAGRICREKGILALTTSTSSGLEYQVLGSGAPDLNPPERINLFSVEALVELVEKAGFEILELSTPGRLDMEIIRKAVESDPSAYRNSFWWYLFTRRGEDAWRSFQQFLQQHQMSSHVRIAARKHF